MKVVYLVIFTIFIAACGSETKELKVIKSHCLTKMKRTPKFCNCMVEKASKNLSEKQLELIVSKFSGDQDRAEEIRKQMSMDEINRMGDFMKVSVAFCVAE